MIWHILIIVLTFGVVVGFWLGRDAELKNQMKICRQCERDGVCNVD